AVTTGDPSLVERLVGNLGGNAVRHNIDRGWVAISTPTRSGPAVLSGSDSGPGVPGAGRERPLPPVPAPGRERRRGPRRGGLGPWIVDAIATAHGARLRVHARPQGGLAIEVDFPAAVLRPAPALAHA